MKVSHLHKVNSYGQEYQQRQSFGTLGDHETVTTLAHQQLRHKQESPRDVHADKPLKGLVKQWSQQGFQIQLVYEPNAGVHAFVHQADCTTLVKNEWIRGIPSEVLQNVEVLKAFLVNSWAKVVKLEDGGYKIYVQGRLKGGVLDPQIIRELREAIEEARKAEGKHVVALVGPTGAGKSTIVNYLFGVEMQYDEENERMDTIGEEIAKIGHGPSETKFARVYEKEGFPFAFVDCGGFWDTRGDETDIVVSTSLKLTLENAASVKLVLCLHCDQLKSHSRMQKLTRGLGLILHALLANHRDRDCSQAFLLMGTHPHDSRVNSSEKVQREISRRIRFCQEADRELTRNEQSILDDYEFALRNDGQYIAVCDPHTDDSRDPILVLLTEDMGRIPQESHAFRPVYTAQARAKLLDEMTAISAHGTRFFTQYFHTKEAIITQETEINRLQEAVDRIQQMLADLGDGETDQTRIEQTIERIVAENQAIRDAQQVVIENLLQQNAEIDVEIEAIEDRKARLLENEEEVEAWSNSIEREAINIESTITTTHSSSKGGGWFSRGKRSEETSVKKTYDKRSIPMDFRYNGPVIARVVKQPVEETFWSDEQGGVGEKKYSVHYESGKGKPASARVAVFVRSCDTNETQTTVNLLSQDILTLYASKLRNTENKGNAERLLAQTTLALQAQATAQERLDECKRAKEELNGSLADYCQQRNVLEEEMKQIRTDIRENFESFQLVHEYLEISQDTELAGHAAVRRFTDLFQRYEEDNRIAEEA